MFSFGAPFPTFQPYLINTSFSNPLWMQRSGASVVTADPRCENSSSSKFGGYFFFVSHFHRPWLGSPACSSSNCAKTCDGAGSAKPWRRLVITTKGQETPSAANKSKRLWSEKLSLLWVEAILLDFKAHHGVFTALPSLFIKLLYFPCVRVRWGRSAPGLLVLDESTISDYSTMHAGPFRWSAESLYLSQGTI